jgi:hypothetical protein
MQSFLADVFDASAPPAGVVEDGTLRLDRLLASPALTANLAFHAAWRAAFGRCGSRADFADFRARAGGNALTECLLERTPVRVLPRAQELVAKAADASARSAGVDVKRALCTKFAERFCSDAVTALAAVEGMGLVEAYAELALRRSNLADYEAWASSDAYREPRGAPTSVSELYARSAAVNRALGIPNADPMTGFAVEDDATTGCLDMTCNEALHQAMMRDGFLWRQDLGGTCIVLPPDGSQDRLMPTSRFHFRAARMPSSVASACTPAGLYATRVAVVDYSVVPSASGDAALVPYIVAAPTLDEIPVDRRVLVDGTAPPEWDARPRAYWIPSPGGAAAWADALRTSMLSAQMTAFTDPLGGQPGAPARGADGALLFHQMVARYAHARGLESRVFHTAPTVGGGEIGEVAIVDSRSNVWTVLSVLIALDNLRAEQWSVRVFCSTASLPFYERCLLPQVPAARLEVLPELDAAAGGAFDAEAYNRLFKSAAFWDRFGPCPRALIVQDDGVLLRPGMDAPGSPFLEQDYVGAPWPDVPAYAQVKGRGVPELVGNGGLSLRRVAAMRDVIARNGAAKPRLFNARLQPEPEDVFFAVNVARKCPAALGERFAVEQRPAAGAPLGFHKPWPYLAADHVAAAFRAVVTDATARSRTENLGRV